MIKKAITVSSIGLLTALIFSMVVMNSEVSETALYIILIGLSIVAGSALTHLFKVNSGFQIALLSMIYATLLMKVVRLFDGPTFMSLILNGLLWAGVYAGAFWLFEVWKARWPKKTVVIFSVLIVSWLIHLGAQDMSVRQQRAEYFQQLQ